jgi:hypothetical protein
MRFAVFFAALLFAHKASASCAVDAAFFGQRTVPLGCTVTLYLRDTSVPAKVVALRNGTRVDVTKSATSAQQDLPIFFEEDGCTHEGHTGTLPMQVATIELQGVVEGDTLQVDGTDGFATATVVAAGTCEQPIEPDLACADDTPEECGGDLGDDIAHSSCSTGGAPSLLLALLFVRRRRRAARPTR